MDDRNHQTGEAAFGSRVPQRTDAMAVASLVMGIAALLLVCGLILDTVVKGNRRQWELEVTRIWNDAAERGERYS